MTTMPPDTLPDDDLDEWEPEPEWTEKAVRAAVRRHADLEQRASRAANVAEKARYGSWAEHSYTEFDFEETDTFAVGYDDYCRSQYMGVVTTRFPISYLWLSDAEITADVQRVMAEEAAAAARSAAAKKAAATRARESSERRQLEALIAKYGVPVKEGAP